MSDITDQGNGGTGVLADLGGVYIDMDQDLVLRDQVGLADGPVRHAGADHQDHIRLIHGPVAALLAVIADHAVEKGMLAGQTSQAHHGGDAGDSVLFGKSPDLRFGTGQMDAAARADDRAFCPGKLPDDTLDLNRVSLHSRLVSP